MADLAEKFQNLEVSSNLFKDVKFYVSGEIPEEVITLLTKGGADQSKYFSDFVTHLICGENPEETDIIDATDVYEVPAVTPKWILISTQLNRLVSTKPYLFNRPQIFASKIFCLSKVNDDLESLWGLITYHGGKVQLNLDQNCNYLVTVDINTSKYEKAQSLGSDKITIITPDWILECVKHNGLVLPDLFHPRLIDWPKPPPPVHHESTTTITGFEESEATDKDNPNDEVANSTQALLEKLKQRMPWNQPEQPQTPQQQQPKSDQNVHPQASPKMKEIVPPNVVAPSFQQKQGEQSQQMLSHQQILQKLQMSQAQGTKSSMSNIPQQMTPEQQQMVQNALQQAQQNIHSQRMNQQNILNAQQQSQMQSAPIAFSQPNVQSQQSSQSNIVQHQQQPIQSPSPLQQSPVAQQGPRAVLHHLPQGQQLQFQQNAGINRNLNRPSLQQLRGQLGTTQLQQQLLQQQQQRLNQQQQPQNILQRSQLTLQQQQLLQLQLQQGQISQARQILQQSQQQLNQNQPGQPAPMNQNQQILSGNQMINTQQLTPGQLSQLQNRAQQLNQQKLAQNHQISQLLAQRQAQLNQRISQQMSSEQLLQSQQIGQPQLATQPMAQNQQMQLNQNRLVNQNQQHLQQMKLAQQQQQQQNQQTIQTSIGQNQQLGQSIMDHSQIGQADQQIGQIQQQNQINQMGNNQQMNQAMIQNQQINQGVVQNQQVNQSLGQNQLNQNLNANQLNQNQMGQGLSQGQLNQGLVQSQMNQGQQQINQQLAQGLNPSHQLVQGGLNQNQQMLQSLGQNQQLNQNLNESLGQSQQMTQTQRLLQSQQLNPQITQTQPDQNQQQQQLTESPRQQINLGLNHILNQQINQGNMVAQQRLNQNQMINQQLNQLNQQLGQNQLGHQQIPQSPIAQSPNQQFGNMMQQQLQNQQQGQQINQLTQVRQVVGGNQQIIQQSQFAQNQQQFGQVQQEGQGQIQQQQQLLNQQQNQFAQQQQVQNQQGIQQTQTVRPHLQQALWAQQQAQQQGPGQIPRPPLNVQQQQGQRVQWPPGAQQGQGVQPRQFIHLDAQTHNQLQKMPPEQQALFIARLQQKQRQLMLKQAQQRGSGHIVIRGPVPAGLNPQQQMAWLQQQANKQGVVLPSNLQQQTVSSTTMSQQPGPQAAAGPSGLNQTPGLSPIQQTSQAQQEHNLKLKQLRLQQLQAAGQVPKGAPTPSLQQQTQQQQVVAQQQQQPGMPRPMVAQPPIAEPPVPIQDPSVGQSQVLVNPKTKTALANMLSIRLQSGGNSVGATQDTLPEPSAAGTLRLMTAQHNASLNANNRPLDLLAMQQQQRRAMQGGPNGDARPSAPQQPLPAIPQADQQQQQVQHSPKSSSVPLQHRPGPFYGHDPNLKLPEGKFFLGCVFVVAEVEDVLKDLLPNYKKKIENYGGEVVKEYCARVTHILCDTQRHGVVMQALRDCKRCVTLYWFEDVMRRRQLLPPWIALHVPSICIDTAPCSKYLISSTGFQGQIKGRVRQMITSTGAKYTNYFTKHNTLLVAARPEGEKYKKAKAWGTPIVNVQWLTDVMLGNYVALQQIENVVYQQFPDPPNFTFDPKLCPNIMHGWKMPINISQEAYEKVKKAARPESGPSKKPRHDDTEDDSSDDSDDDSDEWTTDEDDSDDTEIMREEEDAAVPEENTTQNQQYVIMFSAINSDIKEFSGIVRQLGGTLTNKWNKCTHLVMEQMMRSIKMILCVPRHIPIVPVKWLRDSKAAGKFLDTSSYVFENKDELEEFQIKFGCDVNELLRKENRDKIFQGRTFWISPGVYPNEHMVRRLVEACGGVVEDVRRSAAQIEATNQTAPQSYFIVTVEEDIHLTGDLLRNKKDKVKYICNTELVFHAVINQEISVDPWAIILD